MILETILFSLLGIAGGVILGLLPGLHLNNILPFLLLLSPLINSPYYLVVLIVSLAISQIFASFIPSIFLGSPDAENTSLSVLPGHLMLLTGRGYEAIRLTVIGGIGSLVGSIAAVLFLGNYFTSLYNITRPYIAYALVGVLVLMLLSEKRLKKILYAGLIVCLSGLLGVLVLNSSLVPQQNALFPTFTGLFAISTLLASIAQKSVIPEQHFDNILNTSRFNISKSIALGVIAGILVGLLPAVGVSQAAAFMQYFGGLGDARTFLVTLSGINTANEIVSLNSLYLISNPRSGASVAIEKIFPEISFYDTLLFMGVALFASGIVIPIILYLGKMIPKLLVKVNYTLLSMAVIVFLVVLISATTGFYGILIGITATGIGLLCNYLGVKRSTCMSVLLVPSILFFSGMSPAIFTLLGI